MKWIVVALFGLLLPAAGSAADIAPALGPGNGFLESQGARDETCPGGILEIHSDGEYEGAIAWQFDGVAAPYYGAFAEAFSDTGAICSAVFDLTRLPEQSGGLMDVYVWSDDGGDPGVVLSMTPGVSPGPVSVWPAISRHTVDISDVEVSGSYWVGCWGAWPGMEARYFLAAELDWPGTATPRTNIAPGSGYPSGWQDVSLVWGSTQSVGIGVILAPPAQALRFAGLEHTPLGQAGLAVGEGGLTVSGIGSSGQDGVSIDAGASQGLTPRISTSFTEPGSYMEMSALGTVAGIPGESAIGSVRGLFDGGGIQLIPDFSPLRSTSYTVEIWSDDLLVTRQTGITDVAARIVLENSPLAYIIVYEWGIVDTNRDVPWLTWFDLVMEYGWMGITVGGGSDTHPGNKIRIIPELQNEVIRSITNISVRAAGLSSLLIDREALWLFGQEHQAFRDLTLVPRDTTLTIGNIGIGEPQLVTVGRDNDDDKNGSGGAVWKTMDPAGTAPVGSSFGFTPFGLLGIVEHHNLGSVQFTKQGAASYAIDADLAPVGCATQRIVVYDDGIVVADFPGHGGDVGAVTAWPNGVERNYQDFTAVWNNDVEFTIDAGQYTGDELRILQEGSGTYIYVSEFELLATGIPEITITGEEFLPMDPAGVSPIASRSPSFGSFEAIQPNPASAGVDLRFRLPAAGRVSAQIYDSGGRMVRNLGELALGGGLHGLRWDGRNDSQREVEAGLYLVRAQIKDGGAGRVLKGRVVIVR